VIAHSFPRGRRVALFYSFEDGRVFCLCNAQTLDRMSQRQAAGQADGELERWAQTNQGLFEKRISRRSRNCHVKIEIGFELKVRCFAMNLLVDCDFKPIKRGTGRVHGAGVSVFRRARGRFALKRGAKFHAMADLFEALHSKGRFGRGVDVGILNETAGTLADQDHAGIT
jgi:hypothetical protein